MLRRIVWVGAALVALQACGGESTGEEGGTAGTIGGGGTGGTAGSGGTGGTGEGEGGTGGTAGTGGTGEGGTGGTGPACELGAACDPQVPCFVGETVCGDDGEAGCLPSAAVDDGTACGADRVCFGGACIACVQGEACTPDEACRDGAVDCSTGEPICVPTTPVENGSSCGEGSVCGDGTCTACDEGAPCATETLCRTARIACSTGTPVCEDAEPLPDGSACGADHVCNGGRCFPCEDGASCTLDDDCHVGRISCGTGEPACEDVGLQPDGTLCATGVCESGACFDRHHLVIEAGDAQEAWALTPLEPVTVRLLDARNRPVAGAAIAVAGPDGTYVTPSSGVTDAQGRFAFDVRLPRSIGPGQLTVTGGNAHPAAVGFTTLRPADGILATLINENFVSGSANVPGYAPRAQMGVNDAGLAVASDGTIYVGESQYCRILRVSPGGYVERIAGSGTCTTSRGDGGPAAGAVFHGLRDLALDEANGKLYAMDTWDDAVRVIDLATGTIDAFAGGGPATAPEYGAGGPARDASFGDLRGISVGPDGEVYVGDAGRGWIWRVDAATGNVDIWYDTIASCTAAPAGITTCGTYGTGCKPVFDAEGRAFVAGTICGTAIGTSGRTGILRFDPDGSIHAVAGKAGGATPDGSAAGEFSFAGNIGLAIDGGGNLFVSEYNGHRVRRIDGSSSAVTTVAGTGTTGHEGDLGPGPEAQLFQPAQIATHGTEVLIADVGNRAVRVVWGAARQVPSPAALALAGGDGQTPFPAARLVPWSVRVTDGAGLPVANARVRWEIVDPGASLDAPTSLTDANGVAQMNGRARLSLGTYRIRAHLENLHGAPLAGSPVEFVQTVTAPAPGTVFTFVNADDAPGTAVSGMPASVAPISGSRGLAVASDGTIYFTERDTNRVRKVTPDGVLVHVAGAGAGYGGDGGPATDALLRWPAGVVIDEARGALYVSDAANRRIRRIDLATGIITTIAGGGAATQAPYGDDGPGTDATIGSVTHLSLGPDGDLYLGDPTAKRLRKLDLETGTISSVTSAPAGSFCNGVPAGQYAILSCGTDSECSSAWDAQGNLLLAATWCGGTFGNTGRNAVLRREANGTWVPVAGGPSNGSTADGTPAGSVYLPYAPQVQIGPDGAIYLGITGQHAVRRIDPVSGAVFTVAGTLGAFGVGNEYRPATTSPFSYPLGFGFTPEGHLVISDQINDRIRMVW